jgi:PEP-CTERM motif
MGRLLLALCVFSGFALADDLIDAYATDSSQGGSLWMYEAGSNVNQQFVGVIDIRLTQNGIDYDRETLCVDLFTDIYIGTSYDTSVVMPINVPATDPEKDLMAVSWLIDNAVLPDLYPGKYTSALPSAYWLSPAATSAGTGAELGEALQLAIWDMTVDGGDGLSSGLVRASTDPNNPTDPLVLAAAQYYEQAALGQWSNDAYVYINWAEGNPNSPAQMLEGPLYFDPGPKPVAPEPATFVLVGAALIGIGWSWRRQTRKHRSRPV